jgi:hypothetical protein
MWYGHLRRFPLYHTLKRIHLQRQFQPLTQERFVCMQLTKTEAGTTKSWLYSISSGVCDKSITNYFDVNDFITWGYRFLVPNFQDSFSPKAPFSLDVLFHQDPNLGVSTRMVQVRVYHESSGWNHRRGAQILTTRILFMKLCTTGLTEENILKIFICHLTRFKTEHPEVKSAGLLREILNMVHTHSAFSRCLSNVQK